LFHLQGHRGARGVHPENTLPSFEAAFDAGVSSIETDLHLTRDRVIVLHHDAFLDSSPNTLISQICLNDLRRYRIDRNPDPRRFPDQRAIVTPLAKRFAQRHGVYPFGIPTLSELFQFVEDYAGDAGEQVGKTPWQRQRARHVRFDLELKRVPFHPEAIGDGFDGTSPGVLEECLVDTVRHANAVMRTTVRSFDHRSVRFLRRMEPGLTGAVLIAETTPIAPAELVERADASFYCPDYRFVDADVVRQIRAAGAQILPWTVNHSAEWQRLIDWGVDGITTDLPARLGEYLRERGVAY
jgi:glycerophosphoryl diester phosphodiesterase